MQNPKEVFEITKKKFGLRFDRELADLLGNTDSKKSKKHRKPNIYLAYSKKTGGDC
jgi:hypothetical protein